MMMLQAIQALSFQSIKALKQQMAGSERKVSNHALRRSVRGFPELNRT